MIKINKLPEPKMLQSYRKQPGAQFDGPNFTTVKNAIRVSLLQEQGFVCAYCMRRIYDSPDKTKVEHWVSRKVNPARQLDYKNLLACCDGYEGNRPADQTCDTRKGKRVLKFNPAEPKDFVEKHIEFRSSGRVHSTDSTFNKQLDDVLNLNYTRLIQNRIAVLEELQYQLGKMAGRRTKAELSQMIAQWSQTDANGCFREYYGVVLYDLKVRQRKAP